MADNADLVVRGVLVSVSEADGVDEHGHPFFVFDLEVSDVVGGSAEVRVGEVISIWMAYNLVERSLNDVEAVFAPGIDALVFLDDLGVRRGWRPLLEGFWVGCGDTTAAMAASLDPTWNTSGTLIDLAAAAVDGAAVSDVDVGPVGADVLVAAENLIAVTSDHRVVELTRNGDLVGELADLNGVSDFEVAFVQTVALAPNRTHAYVGVRPTDSDGSSNCRGFVVVVDDQGAAVQFLGVTPTLSSDAAMLAVAVIERDNDICYVTGIDIHDLQAGTTSSVEINRRPDSGSPDWNLSWSPSGQTLAWSGAAGGIVLMAVNDTTAQRVIRPNQRTKMPVLLSDDDVLILTDCCTGSMELSILNLESMSLTDWLDLAAPPETLDLAAPPETIAIVDDSVIVVDANRDLLVSTNGESFDLIGSGYQVADG